MADHIPFINGDTDCELVAKLYADSDMVRITLDGFRRHQAKLSPQLKIWIDAGVDGLHSASSAPHDQRWVHHISQFPCHSEIGDPAFQLSPDAGRVNAFVNAVLDACCVCRPAAITVPQLPFTNDVGRNKINRLMASIAGDWKVKKKYQGRFVLPAIFTDQRQLNKKTERNKRRGVLITCYERSHADVLWAVDMTLADQLGSPTFREARFPGLIGLHAEMQEALPESALTVAGPYWGLNLVLWARGLCHYPAIGLGGSYQYHLSGILITKPPAVRLAVPALRRWVRIGELREWLTQAMGTVNESDPAHAQLAYLRANLPALSTKPASRRQIAQFYKRWCDEIEAVPQDGRALALYQMLSSAYVLGKTLPPFSTGEKTAARPERVAEYLMLSCL